MNLLQQLNYTRLQQLTRRHFLRNCSTGLGAMWLSTQGHASGAAESKGVEKRHFPARANRVIFLHMAGAPSQLELFRLQAHVAAVGRKGMPASISGREAIRVSARRTSYAWSAVSFPPSG